MLRSISCRIIVLAAFCLTTFSQGNLLDEYRTFESVQPYVRFSSTERSKREDGPAKANSLLFDAFGKYFHVDLTLNSDLVSDDFLVTVRGSNVSRSYRPTRDRCHYKGQLKNEPDSVAAVSICTSGISGFIQDGHGETYHLMSDSGKPQKMVVTRDLDRIPTGKLCGVDLESDHKVPLNPLTLPQTANLERRRSNRSRRSLSGPSSTDRNSLFVELVMVGDVKLFEKYQSSETVVINRFIEISSVINALFTPLDIFVILTGVEIWNETDKIVMSNDSETTLKNFMKYRKKELIPRMPNDNAYLISFSSFGGSVVGKALKGQMCTYEYSGGIAKDHSPLPGPVGSTVAHEMGHNFGMEHDFTDCKCPNDRCIMTPASVGQTPSNWSSCSKNYLQQNLARGIGACLKRAPTHAVGPHCGNGFLEDGEECDCGPDEFCRNKCCIASMCRLSVNSTCGHGSCCDMDTCSPKPAASECRSVSGECDLPEYCDGVTGICPNDFWVADGVPCKDGEAYCYDGNCKTHDYQCKYLWDATGAVADDKCYQLNVKGNANGNCGHSRIYDNYTMCDTRNVKCGLLHCTSQAERLAVGAESASSISQSYLPARTTYISCRSAYIDFGLSVPDPGLVPSGAKCGNDMMCLNQVCTPISAVAHNCPSNCGSTGKCNNNGHCHCQIGYGPPDCSGGGYGGSVDSNPSSTMDSYRHFRDAMLIIFLLIVPVLALLIFVFRFRIRDWLLMKRKIRRKKAAAQPPTTATKKPVSNQRPSLSMRISEPVSVREAVNDTVVKMHIGNGIVSTKTELSPEEWPVMINNRPFPPSESSSSPTPPPLPRKPPKAVRDPPVAKISPVVPVPDSQMRSESFEKFNSQPILSEDISITLKPVRPAPVPPRPPVPSLPVSRNSSTGSSTRRARPAERPPDPPGQRRPSQPDTASNRAVIADIGQPNADNGRSEIPKNSLVSELARRFESRRMTDD